MAPSILQEHAWAAVGRFFDASQQEVEDRAIDYEQYVLREKKPVQGSAHPEDVLEVFSGRIEQRLSEKGQSPHVATAGAALVMLYLARRGFFTTLDYETVARYTSSVVEEEFEKKRPESKEEPKTPPLDDYLESLANDIREKKHALERARDAHEERLRAHLEALDPEARKQRLASEEVREALRLLDKRAVVEGKRFNLVERKGVPDFRDLPDDPIEALGVLTDSLGPLPREEAIPIAQEYLDYLAQRFPLPKRGRPKKGYEVPYPFDTGENVAEFVRALECLGCRLRCGYVVRGRSVSLSAGNTGILEARERTSRRAVQQGQGVPSFTLVDL